MFAFGEGGSKKALAGIIFGLGMAMGAANFLDLALLRARLDRIASPGTATRPVSRPLTILGRRAPLVSALAHPRAGDVERPELPRHRRRHLLHPLRASGWWAWRKDPQMLSIVAASAAGKVRYDPGKPSAWHVDILE